MSVNLVKGQKISLSKESNGLAKVIVGLGWDEALPEKRTLFKFGSSHNETASIDCDASIILCGADGKTLSDNVTQSLIFYGHTRHSSGAIVHTGDNLTGEGDGDDEQIIVDFGKMPAEIHKLVVIVNIYNAKAKGQHFGMIDNAYVHVVDTKSNKELCKFNLSDDYSGMTGIIVAEIYRHNGEWKFSAIGKGVKNASRVSAMAELYK